MICFAQLSMHAADAGRLGKLFEKGPNYKSSPRLQLKKGKQKQLKQKELSGFILKNVEVTDGPVGLWWSKAVEPYLNQKVTFKDLESLTETLTNLLREDHGYIFSQVILPPQQVERGHIKFQVIRGTISEVIFEGDTDLVNDFMKELAKNIKQEEHISRKTLERNLMVLAHLPGVNVHVIFKPSKTPSASDMVIKLKKHHGSASLIANNDNTKSLGTWQSVLTGTIENAFDQNERIGVIVARSIHHKRSQYVSASYQRYLLENGLLGDIRVLTSRTYPGKDLAPLQIRNTYTSFSFGASYPYLLERHQRLEFGFHATISTNKSEQRLIEQKNEDKLRSLEAACTYDFADTYGGVNMWVFTLGKGLEMFGATKKGDERIIRQNSTPGYFKTSLELHRQKMSSQGYGWNIDLIGQYSPDSLPSSERFSVGGAPYNRPYEFGIITSDQALMGRVSVRYSKLEAAGVSSVYSYLTYTQAWNRTPTVDEEKTASLVGAGIGAKHTIDEKFEACMEYGYPFKHKIWGNQARAKLFLSVRLSF